MNRYPRIIPASDSALLIEFGDSIDYAINARVYSLQCTIETSDISHAIAEFIPSYRSLLVEYDPSEFSHAQIKDRVAAIIDNTHPAAHAIVDDAAQLVRRIPVVYGGEHGPDLQTVADHAGLTTDDVISIHSGADYHVFMLGFAPGFPYLGGMDPRIACPRLKTPRTLVPAGSVGIAEAQTGVYPNASPGGWQLIGRTPMTLFDINADPPVAMLPGNKVTFVPISHDDYQAQVNSQ